jgi:hypothetical protein
MNTSAGSARYAEKAKRIMDAVELRQTDRVPVTCTTTFWLAKYGGISFRELMYNPDEACKILKKAVIELDPDAYDNPFIIMMGHALDAIGCKQLQWPGHGVGDYHTYQYLDAEYMTATEYDDFIFDPTGFFINKYLPRIATTFEGFSEFPVLPGNSFYEFVGPVAFQFGNKDLERSFRAVQKAAKEAEKLLG